MTISFPPKPGRIRTKEPTKRPRLMIAHRFAFPSLPFSLPCRTEKRGRLKSWYFRCFRCRRRCGSRRRSRSRCRRRGLFSRNAARNIRGQIHQRCRRLPLPFNGIHQRRSRCPVIGQNRQKNAGRKENCRKNRRCPRQQITRCPSRHETAAAADAQDTAFAALQQNNPHHTDGDKQMNDQKNFDHIPTDT